MCLIFNRLILQYVIMKNSQTKLLLFLFFLQKVVDLLYCFLSLVISGLGAIN